MPINILEYENNAIRVLNSRSREPECKVRELQEVHSSLGQLAGQEILRKYPIQEANIFNAQNKSVVGFRSNHSNIVVVTLLRAGLYFSLGVQKNVVGEYIHLLSFDHSDIVGYRDHLIDKDIIIVDSVINSGKTIGKYLELFAESNTVTVTCIVMHSSFVSKCENDYLDYDFYTCRISDNYYVGKGSNDTGNRLFGTK